jgi:UDP-glucuronate 4-epimerase
MAVLVTGVAGFIGYHCAKRLLEQGAYVLGVDNLNAYYDPRLKEARLAQLTPNPQFRFLRMDITDRESIAELPAKAAEKSEKIDVILHLAAQAGVRYSLQNPQAYVDANITGHLSLLEMARHLEGLKHFVYASSSSVYGGNTKVPFSVKDPVNQPISLYAASKRAGELMAHTYAHLFRVPATGLRFFTVYGPWGRPDMAAYLFSRRILAGEPIAVFNNGQMQRDFTFIDDIVDGVMAVIDRPPPVKDGGVPHHLYNLGNSHPEKLTDFIAMLERALGKKAIYDFQPLQMGDVPATFADIEESQRDLGFSPKIDIEEGIPRFVAWYKNYHGIKA